MEVVYNHFGRTSVYMGLRGGMSMECIYPFALRIPFIGRRYSEKRVD